MDALATKTPSSVGQSAKRITKWVLPALHALALVAFVASDIHDFMVKSYWFGPSATYGYGATRTSSFEESPLVPVPTNLSSLPAGSPVAFQSGWPSFLEKCEQLHGSSNDSALVRDARATKCQVGTVSDPIIVHELVMTASLRVDAVAWAGCYLLQQQRRPPFCQGSTVTTFVERYGLSDPGSNVAAPLVPNSNAEKEVLEMLEVISRSYPLSGVVCVEAFQPNGPGDYRATYAGCASPNTFAAVFIGLHAAPFVELQRNLAWLSLDEIHGMGLHFTVRKNAHSSFRVTARRRNDSESDDPSTAAIEHRISVNFSCFGYLYVLVLAADLALIVAHARCSIDAFGGLVLPALTAQNPGQAVVNVVKEYSWMLLYRSGYRSTLIVALTFVSGVLSWFLQVPYAWLGAWGSQSTVSGCALLLSVRVWVLVLCAIHLVWHFIVCFWEAHAYWFAKQTSVSIQQVLALTCMVVVADMYYAYPIYSQKVAAEHQLGLDSVSFSDRVVFWNSWGRDLDFELGATRNATNAIYTTLVKIVVESVLVVSAFLISKLAFFRVFHRAGDTLLTESAFAHSSVYQTLPLEKLLRSPIRAHSIVRSSSLVEYYSDITSPQCYIPPPIYFDFGVTFKNDIVLARRGFTSIIHVKMDATKYFSPPQPTSAMLLSCDSSAVISVPQSRVAPLLKASGGLSNDLNSNLLATDELAQDSLAIRSPLKAHRPLVETVGATTSLSMRRRTSLPALLE